MAEKFYSWSPYVYCYDNPIKFIDPDGKRGVLGGVQVTQNDVAKVRTQGVRPDMTSAETWKNAAKSYLPNISAIVVSVAGKAGIGVFAEGKISAAVVTTGKDQGLHFYATGSVGVEADAEISGAASVDAVSVEIPNRFQGRDLEGKSTETTVEISAKGKAGVSLSKSESNTKNAGKADGYGVGGSYGVGVKSLLKGKIGQVNISTQENNTKGFNTNSYKKENEK